MNSTEHEKLKLTLRSQLAGMALLDPQYHQCIAALNYAEKVHTGLRKDGKNEFYHQISILGFALSLHALIKFPAKVYVAIILHDAVEDYPQLDTELRKLFPNEYEYIVRLSKIRNGIKLAESEYFSEIAGCPVSSIAKGIDRIHNLSSMIVPFSLAKQESYIKEVDDFFLPMLKQAKRNFPEQSPIYEVIKSMLTVQCATITACYKKKS
jgi:(p)ppGpp synthase/HD superfamily hydrolase